MDIRKSDIKLVANPKAVITQFLHLPGGDRVSNIVNRVAALGVAEAAALFRRCMADFAGRHRDIAGIFSEHFDRVYRGKGTNRVLLDSFSAERKLLLGACFTKEYSIQSAALFNPSVVLHPDQQGLAPGEQRFVLSLRATGEGHISSIAFHTGILRAGGEMRLDDPPAYFTPLEQNKAVRYTKSFLVHRTAGSAGFEGGLLDLLPETFTAEEAMELLEGAGAAVENVRASVEAVRQVFDSNYALASSAGLPLNEKVIFPRAKAESMGMEDVRFVGFTENGRVTYYGSYTAYDGRNIKSQLIETDDFNVFRIRTMYGAAVSDKGMALFPEKIGGKYVMISRQGGEKISIMFSDTLYRWDSYATLLEPQFDWELVQLGNCGSPVKTDRGWLLLTHGVGVMRRYVIGALLLDLIDPTRILARLEHPLLAADADEREGYVPNVVYTCGLLRQQDLLFIPYAVSDSAIGFATISLNELLNAMKIVEP